MLSQATGGIFSETYNGLESLASLEAAVLKQSWMVSIALAINVSISAISVLINPAQITSHVDR